MMNAKEAARLIDISAVQAYHGKKEIDELLVYAKKYNFISVHTLPSWTKYISEELSDYPEIFVGAPVGFPSGGAHTTIKLHEASQLISDGVQEMDMVLNIGKLKSKEFQYVEDEIRQVREVACDLPLKVILETHYLTDDEIKRACEICIHAGVDFVKTGTGWAPSGATIRVIKLIKEFVGSSIKVKASGGIRNIETFNEMLNLGVERFGINIWTSIDIVQGFGN
ncbi:deoxyribose-phosphate aldolase [Pleomorphochaeta sp. DL1XJH-081]|jgi:deoxyribose-phosphate aldolase|uniref:deoxyribose-phosphate aldolase n=1 Tax=Pleomorphochaeta sp. DL1XJH-081 TaxID=3409690 RepID=UPI003BB5C499